MNRFETSVRFERTLLVLALAAAFFPAQAQTKVVETIVTFGVGAVDGSRSERAQFGQYFGLTSDSNAFATLGIDYTLRDEESASWVDLLGSNLLGDTRELSLVVKKPGDWKFKADYGELVYQDPLTIKTGLLGVGSTTPQVVRTPAGAGDDLDLTTKRMGLGLGFAKWITPDLQFEVELKTEKKEGSRLFGVGMTCPSPVAPGCGTSTGIAAGWATLFLPEPIDSNHVQVESRLSYAFEKLRIHLGYYGSFFSNNNATLNPSVPGSLNNPLGTLMPLSSGLQSVLSQPVVLAPDNQAHQLDLSGIYNFSNTTSGTFKLGYSRATQDDGFVGIGPAGRSGLGGEVVTTLAKLGISSRPIPKLSLQADLRHENKDDNTPTALYNVVGASSWTNRSLSSRKTNARLVASWQFTSDYRGSIGANYEAIDRGVFTSSSKINGVSALREDTQEMGLNAELRRRMSENFSGAIGISSSRRDGSNWLKPNSGNGVTEVTNAIDPATGFLSTAIFMPTLADRQRDKIKLFADWQAAKDLALQFSAEGGTDSFSLPTAYGLQKTHMDQFSVDLNYEVSSSWALNAYASKGTQTFNQSRPAGYVMAFDNTSIGAGFGFTGKLMSQLVVGGSLSFGEDESAYAQSLDFLAGSDSIALLAATGGLPNIVYRQTSLKFFGRYALDKQSSVRVDFVHQRSSYNDWAWGYNGVPFTYSDGTTVSQKQDQRVSVIGVTYTYQWQ